MTAPKPPSPTPPHPVRSIDQIPFLKLLGLQALHASEPGTACLRLPALKPEFCNMLAAAHGGVVMTLLDVAMARAALAHPKAASGTVVTVEMSTRFVKPAAGALLAHGRALHVGGTLVSCEARVVLEEDDSLVAAAMGTFAFWKPKV